MKKLSLISLAVSVVALAHADPFFSGFAGTGTSSSGGSYTLTAQAIAAANGLTNNSTAVLSFLFNSNYISILPSIRQTGLDLGQPFSADGYDDISSLGSDYGLTLWGLSTNGGSILNSQGGSLLRWTDAGIFNFSSGTSEQFTVNGAIPVFAYGSTNPLDFVGMNQDPICNGHYVYSITAGAYVNSANNGRFLFFNSGLSMWEWSTNKSDTDGSFAEYLFLSGTFPTNMLGQAILIGSFANFQLASPQNYINGGTLVSSTNITGLSLAYGAPAVITGWENNQDDAMNHILEVWDNGISNVPVYIGGIGNQILSIGYTATMSLSGDGQSTNLPFATFATLVGPPGAQYVETKDRWITDYRAPVGGHDLVHKQMEVHYNSVPLIYQWLNPYGHVTFGNMSDGGTNYESPALFTVRQGPTNNPGEHIYPAFMVQSTEGQGVLPTIITNGAIVVDQVRTYIDAQGIRFPIAQVENTNVLLASATTFTWVFGYPFADTNYSISADGAAASLSAPLVGTKTTTNVVVSFTSFSGQLDLIAAHQ